MSLARLPCSYFPTTIVAIDDDIEFLNLLQFNLSFTQNCMIFDNPNKLLNYLLVEYKYDPFASRCSVFCEEQEAFHCHIGINIDLIHHEIYNTKRFNQVSVLIIDFEMPILNGEALCRKLVNNPFKIILLTGELQENKAVQLFNEGVIHRYVRKDDPNYIKILKTSIQNLQFEYFEEISNPIINAIENKLAFLDSKLSFCFSDPKFIQFFRDFCLKNELTEYYLLEESGSILLVDQYGQLGLLLIKNEEDMKAAEEYVYFEKNIISSKTQTAILNREVLIHYFNNIEIHSENDLEQILYPAIKIQGKSNYYYSHLESLPAHHSFKMDRIFTYKNFLTIMDAC